MCWFLRDYFSFGFKFIYTETYKEESNCLSQLITPQTGRINSRNVSSPFWQQSPRSRHQRFGVWWGPASCFPLFRPLALCCILTWPERQGSSLGSPYAGTKPNIRASWPRHHPRPHLQTPSHGGLGANIWTGGRSGAEQHKHSVCSSNHYLKSLHLETCIWNFSLSLAIFPCPVFIIEITFHQISHIVLNSCFVV